MLYRPKKKKRLPVIRIRNDAILEHAETVGYLRGREDDTDRQEQGKWESGCSRNNKSLVLFKS